MEKLAYFDKAMKCIKEPYELWGDYNTDYTQSLMVVFELCSQRPAAEPGKQALQCADQATIDNWMKSKYLLVRQNEVKYVN